MLRSAGLTSQPVFLSTRDNGIIRDRTTPFTLNYDYMIVHVNIDDTDYLIDCTEPLLPFNVLPLRCMNDPGKLIYKHQNIWFNLTEYDFSSLRVLMRLKKWQIF